MTSLKADNLFVSPIGKLQGTELYELTTFSIVLSVQWPLKVEVLLVLSYISETLHVIF